MSSTFLSEQSGQNYDLYCRNFNGNGAINVVDNISTDGDISAGSFALSNNAGSFISNTGGFVSNQSSIAYAALAVPAVFTPQQCNSKDYVVGTIGAGSTITLPSLASFLSTYPYLKVGHTLHFSLIFGQDSVQNNTGNDFYLIVVPGANGTAPAGNPGPGTVGIYMVVGGTIAITGTGALNSFVMEHNFKIVFTGAVLGDVPTGYYVI